MNDKIFKVCRVHGSLTEPQVKLEKSWHGKYSYYKCRICCNERDRRYYANGKKGKQDMINT